jgi:hypothetical protein
LDNFEKGQVRYPLYDLPDGRHTLSLKAWDVYNNSSEKEIYFYVSEIPSLAINQVGNYPNPFRDKTTFRFNSIQNSSDLNALIQIYSLTGQLVKTIESEFKESSQGTLTIPWDGKGDQGQKLSSGMYIYHLNVTGDNGASFRASQKLVISDQ